MQKKILIIEDDHTLRTEVATILEMEGYKLYEADNGIDGFRLAESMLPHLILCDVMMPGMDGNEVLAKIREASSTRLTQFVFITALAEKDYIRHGMEIGADDYLVKPFTRDQLLRSIQSRLLKLEDISQKLLSEMDDLSTRIMAAIPHEMRTPLHAILGFSQLMIDEATAQNNERVAELANYIHSSGKRLLTLINRYSRYVEARIGNPGIPASLDQVLGIVSKVSIDIAASYDRLEDLNLDFPECSLIIAEEDLITIIRELVDNAFKFSARGRPVTVSGIKAVNMVHIQIQDSGRGMNSDVIDKISAFQQFDRNAFEQSGSGIGLITVKVLVDHAGGEFVVESQPGEGTFVHVLIPSQEIYPASPKSM